MKRFIIWGTYALGVSMECAGIVQNDRVLCGVGTALIVGWLLLINRRA